MRGAFGSVLSALALLSLTLACSGCQSTAEKSAELEKHAKHQKLSLRGTSVRKESTSVEVRASTVVHTSVGTAVVVELRNTSRHTIKDAPIEITVRDGHGGVLFQNNQSGTEPSLTKVSLLKPGAQTIWVDDQVQTAGLPSSATAVVGEGAPAPGSTAVMSISGTHLTEEGGETGLAGNVTNKSKLPQEQLVVYAVARKAGRVVAAGRATLPEVASGANVPFQVYFVGDPRGARIETSAPATTF